MNAEQLKENYFQFFDLFDIDKKTGKLENNPNIKFVTMPYIGSKYQSSKEKILFVGMDVGKDETPGRYQDFTERNINIEVDKGFNPHIAGTYSASLYLLQEVNKWQTVWNNFSKFETYSKATKLVHHKNDENPLSYVALTNLHKFVTIDRKNRAGDLDRKFINKEIEENFLIEEIKLFKPDVIFFQGKLPSIMTLNRIKDMNIRIIKALHPSNRKKGGRNPLNYAATFTDI